MLSTRCQCDLGGRTIAWNAKKYLIRRISTSVNQNTIVECVRKILACTSHPTQDYVNNVLMYFATIPVSIMTEVLLSFRSMVTPMDMYRLCNVECVQIYKF